MSSWVDESHPPRWLNRASYVVLVLGGVLAVYATVNYAIEERQQDKMINKGERAIGTVLRNYKQRCGGGYGYTAEFEFTAGGRVFHAKHECVSREWVRVGDRFPVVFPIGDTAAAVILIGDP